MNVLAEAAITAVVGKFVSDAIAKKSTAGKADTIVDPIPKASPTNAQPQQPIATSVRDTQRNVIIYPGKTLWIGHTGNGPMYGDPVPGTAQIISRPTTGQKQTGKVSTTIFKPLTDPADAGNVTQNDRMSFYIDPVTGERVNPVARPVQLKGISGGVYMLMAEHAGTPAETVNDPQTALVQPSLIPEASTLAPGIKPKILPLNPTQKIPIGAKWAALAYA